jgi:hypothetical protein
MSALRERTIERTTGGARLRPSGTATAMSDDLPLGRPVDIATLPPANISGIYFLHWKGSVVYVGQGRSVRARIGAHIAEGVKTFDAITMIECDRSELLSRERKFIRRLAPMYNRCAVADRARRPKDAAREWLSSHR